MSKKLITLIIVFVALSVTVLVWSAKKTKKRELQNQQTTQQQQEQGEESGNQDAINISSWNLYKNKELGLQFKHISNWTIESVPPTPMGGEWLRVIPVEKTKETKLYECPLFYIRKFKSEKNPREWAKDELRQEPIIEEEKELSISGNKAHYLKVKAASYLDHNYVVSNEKGAILYVSFRESKYGYDTSGKVVNERIYSEYLPYFKAMIETLEFLDEEDE